MRKRKGVSTTSLAAVIVVIIVIAVGGYWWMTQQKPTPEPTPTPTPTPTPEPTPKENLAPTVAAYVSIWSGDIGESVEFDASRSRDPDGTITKYTWDFGDGITEETTSEIITHVYDVPGEYIILLTVEDDAGATASNEKSLTYFTVFHSVTAESVDSPPTAVLAVDKDVLQAGDTVNFQASSSWAWASTETGLEKNPEQIVSWVMDFGDGEQGEGKSVDHTYSNVGRYVAKLTVTAENGKTASFIRTIHVLSPEAEYEGVVKNPNTLILTRAAFPYTLDYADCHLLVPGELLDNMYDKLVWFRENVREVEPWLAESWNISDDGLTYTFHLRQGVKFHDGTELTAEDVEYSFERNFALFIPEGHASTIVGPLLAATSPADFTMDDVRNAIEAPDDYTVVFTLKKPFAPFLKLLTDFDMVVVNKDLVIANGGWNPDEWTTEEDKQYWLGRIDPWLTRNDAGSGPYKMLEFVPGQRIVLDAFEDYWQGVPVIKRVICLYIPEMSTRVMMLKNGDVDAAELPITHRAQVEGVEGITIYSGMPSNDVLGIQFNFDINTDWNPPEAAWLGGTGKNTRPDLFQDIHLRKAFIYSFPYEEDIELTGMGEAVPAHCPVPPGWFGYSKAFNYTQDMAKAEEQFKKAWDGRIWEEGFTIHCVYAAGTEPDRVSLELLKDSIESINPKFNILILAMDAPVVTERGHAHANPFGLSWDWINYPDPHVAFEQQLTSYSFFAVFGRYNNSEVDELIKAAAEEVDIKVREGLYFRAAEIACSKDPAYAYRYHPTAYFVGRDWLKGYYYNPYYCMLYWYMLSK